jgi:hypothetical protein
MSKKLFTIVVIVAGLVVQFSCVAKKQKGSVIPGLIPASSEPVVETPISNGNIPDTPEAKEIMEAIERAYDIQVEAAYTFDFSKFPTVFINDPRFPVNAGTLETVRQLTYNPSLESAGWLDYKMAYYSWKRDSILHFEAVHATAQAENRALSEEERKSLTDSYGRTAPSRSESPKRTNPIIFKSVEIGGDIATVVLNEGVRTVRLTLVFADNNWYIAASETLSVHP